MKPLYDREKLERKVDRNRANIKCIKCGEIGFADADICPSCGAKYPLKAIIIDINMQFWSMVRFMVKWAFAAIPAIFLIAFIVSGIMILISVFFGVIGHSIKSYGHNDFGYEDGKLVFRPGK